MDNVVYGASPRHGNGPFRLRASRNSSAPTPAHRLVLLAENRGLDGLPRVALLPPGARARPLVYDSVGAAIAALRRLQAGAVAAP